MPWIKLTLLKLTFSAAFRTFSSDGSTHFSTQRTIPSLLTCLQVFDKGLGEWVELLICKEIVCWVLYAPATFPKLLPSCSVACGHLLMGGAYHVNYTDINGTIREILLLFTTEQLQSTSVNEFIVSYLRGNSNAVGRVPESVKLRSAPDTQRLWRCHRRGTLSVIAYDFRWVGSCWRAHKFTQKVSRLFGYSVCGGKGTARFSLCSRVCFVYRNDGPVPLGSAGWNGLHTMFVSTSRETQEPFNCAVQLWPLARVHATVCCWFLVSYRAFVASHMYNHIRLPLC